jgi:hypothetical protein
VIPSTLAIYIAFIKSDIVIIYFALLYYALLYFTIMLVYSLCFPYVVRVYSFVLNRTCFRLLVFHPSPPTRAM